MRGHATVALVFRLPGKLPVTCRQLAHIQPFNKATSMLRCFGRRNARSRSQTAMLRPRCRELGCLGSSARRHWLGIVRPKRGRSRSTPSELRARGTCAVRSLGGKVSGMSTPRASSFGAVRLCSGSGRWQFRREAVSICADSRADTCRRPA